MAEPLPIVAQFGIHNSVLAVQPWHRGPVSANRDATAATWIRYVSIPSGVGLASAGAFLFAHIVGRLRTLHREHRIDVFHAHGPLPCGHAAMLVARELKIPFVVSVHGLDAYSDRQVQGVPGRWCRQVTQLVFRSAARVICVSEHVRERVLEGCRNASTSVVYNGVDAGEFCPEQESSRHDVSILTVGNLIPIKGHALLLKALHSIKDDFPEVSCDIVGTGPEKTHLEDLAKKYKMEHKIRFLGRLSRKELANAFRRCSIFVLPSRYEGLGCVYLEAMSSEKVAVGCRGQGIEEIIQHGINGWLVAPEDVEELSAGLRGLLSNAELRRSIGARGRQTILESLTLRHQAARLAAIYRELSG